MPTPTDTFHEICVFVDTNYLRAVPHPQKPDWQRMLLLSQQGKVKVFTSFIAREEWRTGRRDKMLAERARTKTALRELRNAAKVDLLKDELHFAEPPEFLPSETDIDEASERGVQRFLTENKIIVIEPTHEQQMSAWAKYFSWEAPFQTDQMHNRDVDEHRTGRKEHIPDAWIAEAALDMHTEGNRVLFLGSDGNLGKALKGSGIEVYREAREILEIINIPVEASPIVPDEVMREIARDNPPAAEVPRITDEPSPTSEPPHDEGGETATRVPPEGPIDHGDASAVEEGPSDEEPSSSTIPAATDTTASSNEGAGETDFPSGSALDAVSAALKNYDISERGLQIRMLGYTHWTAPISKETLFQLLEKKGYQHEHIRNVCERMVLGKFVQDTGQHYTPFNKEVCQNAASLVILEVEGALDE